MNYVHYSAQSFLVIMFSPPSMSRTRCHDSLSVPEQIRHVQDVGAAIIPSRLGSLRQDTTRGWSDDDLDAGLKTGKCINYPEGDLSVLPERVSELRKT